MSFVVPELAAPLDHLVREYNKALEAKTTQPCNRQCSACGANKLIGGPCFDYSKNLL